ncbi:MAG: RNA polymerase subunit sigma-70 [Archangium gephyra]|uniref:RNA polymerase subunit sigma-70 n=1 Tax=Archangium gephyra TaxID=48 RepID=A0A2W5T491_9BACT|nr:MAG: RNA polymerase subunit sigma-70 [Archangium gephyra]
MTAELQPDSARFGALYAAHFRSVWRTLQRLGVFPAFTDDAAQEVFVTAWRRWSEFEGRSSERTWLLGIALRVASDVRRKQRSNDEVPVKLAIDAPLPDAVTAARQQSRRVEALLRQLDEERREVLLLCDVEGYTIPEVAEATGVNLNTLYTRLRTARQQFEALVKREREEL